MDLSVNYLGLKLRNPLIAGACPLTADVHRALELEEAGVAAIVYRSLFEEQLHMEAAELEDELAEYAERNAEMISLFPSIQHSGPKAHLLALKEFKEAVSIPVIASLNCLYKESWEEYALHLASTGVDALELNFYSTISESDILPESVENVQIEALKRVVAKVKIPVSVKLSPYYTNPLSFIKKLDATGAKGFVLFNRLFQPDINIEEEKLEMPYNLSKEGDSRLSLRYMGLLEGNVKASLCANTGILNSGDVIAAMLAGADAVQMVTTLYKKGSKEIPVILKEISNWMAKKGYKSTADFKGKLSKRSLKDPYSYKRAQYVEFLMKSSGKYPVN